MYLALTLCAIVVYLASIVKSVPPPPDICFQKFRFDDCGLPPKPVMYYWKPGSRCEVGFWRGCLPNVNMFKDEFECVSTCIFARRARPNDFHVYNALHYEDPEIYDDEIKTVSESVSSTGTTNGTTNGTATTASGEVTGTGSDNNTDSTHHTSPETDSTGASSNNASNVTTPSDKNGTNVNDTMSE